MSEGDQPDDTQKTEDPSAKKLEEARKKGQVPVSREVNNWLMLTAATLLLATYAPSMMARITTHLQFYIGHFDQIPDGAGGLAFALHQSAREVFKLLILPFIVLAGVAFLGPFLQAGPLFAPEVVRFDWSKISPVKGFERLFSTRSLMEFAKGLIKIAVISAVGGFILYPYFSGIDHMVGMNVAQMMAELKMLVIRMMIGVLVVLMVIAVIDLIYQRATHYQKMRMTKQEVRDEYKQSEGDPQIKARLRALRNERARRRMIQAVPSADVVITNPTHFSIALKYKPEEMAAPVCVAKGTDRVALRIREVARENNVVVVENVPLARALYDVVEIDEEIPAEHYKAVAEVISYVFKLRGTFKR